jgi:hypothetical protein
MLLLLLLLLLLLRYAHAVCDAHTLISRVEMRVATRAKGYIS